MIKINLLIALIALQISCFAFTLQENSFDVVNKPTDTIVIELENNTKILIIADNIEEFKNIEKYSLDSLLREINIDLSSEEFSNASDTTIVVNIKGNSSDVTLTQSPHSDNVKYHHEGRSRDYITISGTIGLGLIGGELSPNAEGYLGFGINKYFFNFVANPNFTFYRDDEGYLDTHINGFLSLECGLRYEEVKKKNSDINWGYNIGIGYLARSEGKYFKGNTFKVYTDVNVGKVSLLPQIIITEDFKKIYPSVGLRFAF